MNEVHYRLIHYTLATSSTDPTFDIDEKKRTETGRI